MCINSAPESKKHINALAPAHIRSHYILTSSFTNGKYDNENLVFGDSGALILFCTFWNARAFFDIIIFNSLPNGKFTHLTLSIYENIHFGTPFHLVVNS